MLDAKLLFVGAVALGLVWWVTKDGKVTIVPGESYYGAGGRCYRLSDDEEVPVKECIDRGEEVGIDPFIGGRAKDAVVAIAGAVGDAFGGLGSFWGGKEELE